MANVGSFKESEATGRSKWNILEKYFVQQSAYFHFHAFGAWFTLKFIAYLQHKPHVTGLPFALRCLCVN